MASSSTAVAIRGEEEVKIDPEVHCILTLVGPGSKRTTILLKWDSPFGKLRRAFERLVTGKYAGVRLKYFVKGRTLDDLDTPRSLGFDPQEFVDVFPETLLRFLE